MRYFVFLLSLITWSVSANPRVVTSIVPLYQVTRSIMQGVSEPVLLIDPKSSAHHFSFKPSHRMAIENAELVIWVDRHFENGFQKLPLILPENSDALELLRALQLEGEDGHIWYSPTLLLQAVAQIELALTRVDQKNAQIYQTNASQLTHSIKTWETLTRAQFGHANPRYLLDHEFLIHFENDIGIKSIASVYDSHEQSPGIRELKNIEQQLIQTPALCLLTNEAEAGKLSLSLARQFELPVYNITPEFDTDSTIMQTLNRVSSVLLGCS